MLKSIGKMVEEAATAGEKAELRFVQACVEEFGASYSDPRISPDTPIHIRRGRVWQEFRDVGGIRIEAIALDPVDLDWLPSMINCALDPGQPIGFASKEKRAAFAFYIQSRDLGDALLNAGGLWQRATLQVRLNAKGRQLVWDLLRLFQWPATNRDVLIEEPGSGTVIYQYPPSATDSNLG